LFIIVTCSQFDVYLLIFSANGTTFISSKIYSFFCDQKGAPAVLLKNFVLIDISPF
jgi:hypothetical protein